MRAYNVTTKSHLYFSLMIILILFAVYTNDAREKSSNDIPVYLNHFILVLDNDTYSEIENNDFLKNEFAVFEKRTTVRNDLSYTGIYFYGTHTYFEFFDAAAEKYFQQGVSGIALGVDREGDLLKLNQRLSKELKFKEEKVTRLWKNNQVPWFSSLFPGPVSNTPLFFIWIMEYNPLFLQQWHPNKHSSSRGITRRQILERYTAVIKKKPTKPLLEDVVEIRMAVDPDTNTGITKICQRLGYQVIDKKKTTILTGPGFTIYLKLESSFKGIQQVKLKVKEAPRDQKIFKFGERSILKFHDNGFATWYF